MISGVGQKSGMVTDRNKNSASKETVPGIFSIVDVPTVKKNWPLVSSNHQFSCFQFLLHPRIHQIADDNDDDDDDDDDNDDDDEQRAHS